MRDNAPRPAKLVTDAALSTVCVSVGISRDLYEKFGRIAGAHGLTKAAFLRRLIVERVEEDG